MILCLKEYANLRRYGLEMPEINFCFALLFCLFVVLFHWKAAERVTSLKRDTLEEFYFRRKETNLFGGKFACDNLCKLSAVKSQHQLSSGKAKELVSQSSGGCPA